MSTKKDFVCKAPKFEKGSQGGCFWGKIWIAFIISMLVFAWILTFFSSKELYCQIKQWRFRFNNCEKGNSLDINL